MENSNNETRQSAPAPQAQGSAGSKKMNKGLLWGLIGGGVGLVLLIVLIVAAIMMFSGPSKDDYQKAYNVVDDIRTSYNQLSSVSMSYYSITDSSVKHDIEKIETTKKEVNKGLDELGKMKAIKNDADVNKLYKDAEAKRGSFNQGADLALEIYKEVLPTLSEFEDKDSGSREEQLSAIKDLYAAFEKMDVKQEVNKQFKEQMLTQLEKAAKLTEKMIEMTSDYSKYDSNIAHEYYGATSEISKITRKWQTDVQTAMDKADLAPQMRKLQTELTEKQFKQKK